MEKLTKIFQKYQQQFSNLGQKQKLLILGILAFSFVFGLGGQIGFQKLTNKPTPTPLPSPTEIPLPAYLELTSVEKTIEPGATFSATLNIDSPNQGVEAGDFVINFDPNYLNVATLSSGNYFGLYPIKNIGTESAKISGIANLVNNRFIIPKGKGIIATFVFETLQASDSTKVKINTDKTIVASGGKNILENTKDLNIQIGYKE